MRDFRNEAKHNAKNDAKNDARRFVTFPLGEQRYALESSQVKELVMPGRVYTFPHTMRSLEGVLVRRGEAIPVCDLGGAFGPALARSFYVIAECQYAGRAHTVAIAVSGDCELVQGKRDDAPVRVTFVAGLLRTGGKTIPMLDLDQVVAHCIQPSTALASEAKP
jgi:chemotaxis signal transduction protein